MCIVYLQLKCCGVDIYSDWFEGAWEKKQKQRNTVPKSCCKKAEDTCVNIIPSGTVNSTEIYTEVRYRGCKQCRCEIQGL